MSLPGPSGLTWALELLLFAGVFLPAGELIRRLAARWVPLFQNPSWVERLLVDLYLGGGGLYVLALVPLPLFTPPLVGLYLVGAASVLVALVVREARATRRGLLRGLRGGWELLPGGIVLAATLAVFAIEVAIAEGVPTGNSFDTSILTDYVALLLQNHHVPLSLVPIAPQLTSYPQGTTVWLGAAQMIFSLPPARTPLLVTPLFLSLSPLAGYVLGRRQLGSPWAGLAIGLTFALIGSWTRVVVATSNDFVFSFPLVVWLLARSDLWRTPTPLTWPDAVAFGGVLGYSAAMNPVGAEWLFPTVVVLGLLTSVRRPGYLRIAVPRWIVSLVASLLFVTPALWTIVRAGGVLFPAAGNVPIPAVPGAPGISPAQFVGSIDPFLFRPQDVWLSPFPALRFELAALLIAGALILVVPSLVRRLGPRGPPFRELVATTVAAAVALLALQVGAAQGLTALDSFAVVSSGPQVSIYLFAVYVLLAALPLYLLVEYVREKREDRTPEPIAPGRPASARTLSSRSPISNGRAVALVLVAALLVPGVVVTGTDFPSYLQELYGNYGRVTPSDFALFAWAALNLPTGARVLVAPGSAAQFLPGYARVALLYPVQPIARNASYVALDRELVRGNLTAAGFADLTALDVQYIAVTGNTTDLWAPFSPIPLLANPTVFGPPLFHSGDAYLFQVRG